MKIPQNFCFEFWRTFRVQLSVSFFPPTFFFTNVTFHQCETIVHAAQETAEDRAWTPYGSLLIRKTSELSLHLQDLAEKILYWVNCRQLTVFSFVRKTSLVQHVSSRNLRIPLNISWKPCFLAPIVFSVFSGALVEEMCSLLCPALASSLSPSSSCFVILDFLFEQSGLHFFNFLNWGGLFWINIKSSDCWAAID